MIKAAIFTRESGWEGAGRKDGHFPSNNKTIIRLLPVPMLFTEPTLAKLKWSYLETGCMSPAEVPLYCRMLALTSPECTRKQAPSASGPWVISTPLEKLHVPMWFSEKCPRVTWSSGWTQEFRQEALATGLTHWGQAFHQHWLHPTLDCRPSWPSNI